MQIEKDALRFECSGREFYAYGGIVGLAPDLSATYGSDGSLPHDWDEERDGIREFTPEERRELAQHMIAKWSEFAAAEPQ